MKTNLNIVDGGINLWKQFESKSPSDIIQYIKDDAYQYWINNSVSPYNGSVYYYMTEKENLIVGILLSVNITPEFHVKRFFVSEDYRGKQIGTQLLEHAWYIAYRFKNSRYIRMYCDPDAINWYKKLGFKMWGLNDKGYAYVYYPMMLADMKKNNRALKDVFLYDLVDDNIIKEIEKLALK